MKKEKYDAGFAASLTATASILGPIIPPSIMMIIYGSMSGVSIGKLFMAGIVPGLVLAMALMFYCYFYARKHNIVSTNKRSSSNEVFIAFKDSMWALILPVIIIGGIRFGIFSPTEAGIIAVAYALILGLIQRTIKVSDVPNVLVDAAVMSAISLMIIAAAAAFGWILANQLFPQMAVQALTSISSNPLVVYLLIFMGLLFIGLFLEGSAAIIILIPVLIGIQKTFEYDPVHFGIIVILTLVIGGITPPVGNLLMITASIGKLKMSEVFWKVWPFVGVMVFMTFLMIIFPKIITFLPSILK